MLALFPTRFCKSSINLPSTSRYALQAALPSLLDASQMYLPASSNDARRISIDSKPCSFWKWKERHVKLSHMWNTVVEKKVSIWLVFKAILMNMSPKPPSKNSQIWPERKPALTGLKITATILVRDSWVLELWYCAYRPGQRSHMENKAFLNFTMEMSKNYLDWTQDSQYWLFLHRDLACDCKISQSQSNDIA